MMKNILSILLSILIFSLSLSVFFAVSYGIGLLSEVSGIIPVFSFNGDASDTIMNGMFVILIAVPTLMILFMIKCGLDYMLNGEEKEP